MKIWLSKNSEVPVREQIITQIILGITSGDLPIGERLPSTREIARRFGVHSNTVSGAYQQLVEQGWLEFRHGSGFFVREDGAEDADGSLDRIIAEFFRSAQKKGFSYAEIRKRTLKFLDAQPPENFLLIESDAELRQILAEEIKQATGFRADEKSFEDFQNDLPQMNSVIVAMFDEKAKIQQILPSDRNCVFLKSRSVADSMVDQPRPTREKLIGVVSGWRQFLLMAKTILLAANIDAESLLIRSTNEAEWKKGLDLAEMIICDSLTAAEIPNDERVRVFRLISDESVSDLRQFADKMR